MISLNYFSGVVKVLENPIQNLINDKILKTTFRVEIPQIRQNKIVSLVFWDNLSYDIKSYYQVNDYLLIEGYTSIEKKSSESSIKDSKKIIITVLKVYPFLLKSKSDIVD